ncbi:XRE family transcriptional regulator [Paenibacillus lentus]|uniref:XRE family transcriptional regulator n=1 Tax=Paenibacillus lentus TaxID=1338368 RepID=A0A3Q8SBG0_9BACL|nr:XRE family transcriptional regulator [Paenibacillus lentus]AZK46776.1 XRE family transcriptional regulator [Paenibacillus lentus]
MTNEPMIRSVIEQELERGGYSLSSFASRSGINRGTLSAILNGNPPKPIAISQLDLITEALEYPKGYYYPLYVDECVDSDQPNRRRLKAFLLRCAEVGQIECIQEVLNRIVENLNYIPMIFDIGEELYEKGLREESRLFYNVVIESEKYQHSERLAISHYRIFRLSLGDDTEANLIAATRFELYRTRLPEDFQLDGLLHLINVYLTLQKYEQAEIYTDELRRLAKSVYKNYERAYYQSKDFQFRVERHLIVYYGQGYLLKGVALQFQRRFEEVPKYIAGYADLSWFVGLDELGKQMVEKYKLFAKLNIYNLKVLSGDQSVITEYIELVKDHPYEILPSLRAIVESANMYGYFVDDLLEEFDVGTKLYDQFGNYYNTEVSRNRYLRLNYHLSVYYFRKEDHLEGIKKTLYTLKYAISLSSKDYFMKIVPLFERYRSYATDEQLKEYETLLKGVLKDAEMDYGINSRC